MATTGNPPGIGRNDPRPTEELIHIALTEPDENVAWDAVTVLQYRGSQEVLNSPAAVMRQAWLEHGMED